jgi:hypothetical protein
MERVSSARRFVHGDQLKHRINKSYRLHTIPVLYKNKRVQNRLLPSAQSPRSPS